MGGLRRGDDLFRITQSDRQIQEVSEAFRLAHELGMACFCVLLAQRRVKVNGVDYHTSADLTGQADYLGSVIEADIVKQKLPEINGGYKAINQAQKDMANGRRSVQ